MLYNVTVTSSQGTTLNLPVGPDLQGLLVEEIEGLDPVKATIVSSGFAQLDGEQYQSSKRESRNLKFKIGLEEVLGGDTVRQLRQRLYSVFMPKSHVNLLFHTTDGGPYAISGVVESFETVLFSSEPAVDISVMCFNPDFSDVTSTIVNGSTTAGSTETSIDYPGTVETGFVFKITLNRSLSAFTIYHNSPDGAMSQMDFQAPMNSGDILEIGTVQGTKYAKVTRAGTVSSILYAVSPQSKWTELLPGVNNIRVYATGASIPYTIEYFNKYGGL